MDSTQAGQMIERLLAMHKSLQMEKDRGISTLERDTILEYLRKLYDHYHEQQPSKAKPVAKASTSAPIARAQPRPTPAPKPTPPPPAPAPKPVVAAKPASRPAPQPQAPRPAPTPPPAANIPSRMSGPVPAKVKALFEDKSSNELSDKLARTPIADLTKALSIVDRALYANELFDSNQELMNNFLADCNRHSSFDQARESLAELAVNHGWAEGGKAETAKNFIKLVRRRYA
ncbi:MAG: hypothetical protein AAF741_10060 [Bacteroidota bacterium]